jgi:hypothetical protein
MIKINLDQFEPASLLQMVKMYLHLKGLIYRETIIFLIKKLNRPKFGVYHSLIFQLSLSLFILTETNLIKRVSYIFIEFIAVS